MEKKIIEHISGSCLNAFDNHKQQFYNRYVLGITTKENEAMKFGKDYEDIQARTIYKGLKQQIEINELVEGYKILGYVDFGNSDVRIECKTKNGWRTKDMIRNNWQFRIYNYFRGNRIFLLHQYNKKLGKHKVDDIGFDDHEFIPELYCKIKEIEKYLNDNGVKLLRFETKKGLSLKK